jgi:hypothetical protein
MIFRDAGIDSDNSAIQLSNTFSSSCCSLDSGSKISEESAWHLEKQLLHRISTDAGMQIDFKHEQYASTRTSIRLSFDPHSNINDEIKERPKKHPNPRLSISRINVGFGSVPKYRTTVRH